MVGLSSFLDAIVALGRGCERRVRLRGLGAGCDGGGEARGAYCSTGL